MPILPGGVADSLRYRAVLIALRNTDTATKRAVAHIFGVSERRINSAFEAAKLTYVEVNSKCCSEQQKLRIGWQEAQQKVPETLWGRLEEAIQCAPLRAEERAAASARLMLVAASLVAAHAAKASREGGGAKDGLTEEPAPKRRLVVSEVECLVPLWECGVCTVMNDSSNVNCATCGDGRRPAALNPAFAALVSGVWLRVSPPGKNGKYKGQIKESFSNGDLLVDFSRFESLGTHRLTRDYMDSKGFDTCDAPPEETPPARAAEPPANAPSNDAWTCEACTFSNDPTNTTCAICEHSRPAALAPAEEPKSNQEQEEADWACEACTFLNDAANTTCGMCAALNPAAPPEEPAANPKSNRGAEVMPGVPAGKWRGVRIVLYEPFWPTPGVIALEGTSDARRVLEEAGAVVEVKFPPRQIGRTCAAYACALVEGMRRSPPTPPMRMTPVSLEQNRSQWRVHAFRCTE
eukprot:Hpha_TRINITY_DN15643_c1_g14::TRINITY_DN15643_c1_g14_i1::g.101295::m.101295